MEKCKFCGDSSCHTVTIVIDKEPFDKKVTLDVCPSCSIFIDMFGIVTDKLVVKYFPADKKPVTDDDDVQPGAYDYDDEW